MIVRTYARRNRCIGRSYSDSSFNETTIEEEEEELEDSTTFRRRDSLSQDSVYNFTFSSSQDSCPWTQLDSDSQPSSLSLPPPGTSRPPLPKPKKGGSRNLKVGKEDKNSNGKVGRSNSMPVLATSTLMEAQEFGEMMEHVDEVNFALDGLKKGQPARIRRSSLLSLLSICGTVAKRRLLRTQGMAKTILDAILSLSLDDSPSALAAAALFYILASDGEDEQLLDSPTCIQFLLRLLSPSLPITSEEKRPTVGSKLLALCRNPDLLGNQPKGLDASSTAIISKVQEILLSCKEIQASNRDDEGLGRPELTPKWISLLTMEKACLSTVSIEDTSATVKKLGGNFKETFRELGGLEAVFDVAAGCHSVMESWPEPGFSSDRELKDDVASPTVVLLLKCLKIMENATFLSKENQDHVLGMNTKSGCVGSSLSFTSLVISVIKILSGLSLRQSSSISSKDRSHSHSNGKGCASESELAAECEAERDGNMSRNSSRCLSIDSSSHVQSFKGPKKRQKVSTSHTVYTVSNSETFSYSDEVSASQTSVKAPQKRKKMSTLQRVYTVSSSKTTSSADVSVTKEDKPSTSCSYNGTSKRSNGRNSRNTCRPKVNIEVVRRSTRTKKTKDISLEDSQDPFAFDDNEVAPSRKTSDTSLEDRRDPFAFDEEESAPSKWTALSTGNEITYGKKRRGTAKELEKDPSPLSTSLSESDKGKDAHSCGMASSSLVEVENSSLLADCLLAAVKVLMNLTNDNPVGCKQIAACGGLETLSTLIGGHYPSFSSSLSSSGQTDESIHQLDCSTEIKYENGKHFTDQELDFLVAILGLLVNLVEKDSRNRSRLAAIRVSVPTSGGSEGTNSRRDVIPLLCSIFLANQGAGETSAEPKATMPWDDETAVLEGEHEAEKMIIEAYSALLLAFLSTESKNVREAIAQCLPDHNLEVLVPVLERFVAFHLTLNMISPETHKAVTEVIESCKGLVEEVEEDHDEESL